MSSLCEDDSDDDDIFVVRRLQPVGKLTKRKALEIKKRVLDRERLDRNLNDDNNINSSVIKSKNANSFETSSDISNQKEKGVFDDHDDDDISILEEKINKAVDGGSNAETPVKSTKTPEKSPPKLITNYFTPTKRLSVELNENLDEETSFSDMEKKRKKLKNDSVDGEVGNSSKSQSKSRRTVQSGNSGDISSNLDNSSGSGVKYKNIYPQSTGYYYSKSLKGIIHHEILNQALLEQKSTKEGKKFGRLFLESDFQDVEKFFKLPENAFELFARMICRKKGWHRISTITYDNIEGKIEDLFRFLNKQNFVDIDIEKQDLETQLNLLSKPELQILCKAFNIRSAGIYNKKNDFIDAIVKSVKSQRGVTEMWKKDSSRREELLRNEITKALGPCMKLNDAFLSLLNRILLLFSLPYYIPEEDKWSTLIQTMIEINMNIVSFPSYTINSTVIFDNRDDLICYERALKLMYRCEGALVCKNNEEFEAVRQEAKAELKKLLEDEGFKERVKSLPPFLRRYNAGTVYAKILTTYCERLKKIKDPKEVVEIMEMLIGQDSFAVNKKGSWYNRLVQGYCDLGKSSEAGSALLKALKEETINEVAKLQLQQRGGLLLKKKKNGLTKGDMRDELDDICTVDMMEPSKVEIKARAMDKRESGYKSVYMYKDKTGALTFLSVEETVINHYKANGFPQGVHAEGFIIQTLYFLVFFDIIYKLSPVGVFQNPYQTEPMDFASRSFYLNRKTEIDARLEEMRSWSMKKFQEVITQVYTENLGVRCVISWKEGYTPRLLCEILRCLGTKQFIRICERLVHNFRVYRSGFPDLTIWNPVTKKCKFVEVKSPNDKLSPNQRLWLDFLRKLNVDCEVCNVKNIASRSVQS